MNRRAFLGLAASVGLAGCGGSDEPTPTVAVQTDTDSATSTPTPGQTATATPTAEPTPEPTDSPTPEPTDSPTPEPTDTPTPEPTPAPDEASYSFSGSGGDVTDEFDTAGGLVVFDLSHNGSSNFIVYAVDESGNEELLANHIGSYDGQVALYLPSANYVLDIDADGSWSADVTQPRYSIAEVEDLPDSGSGTHAGYFGPYEFQGRSEFTIRVTNDSHAAVWLTNINGEEVDLLANDIGPYETTTTISADGHGLIVIDTEGAEWEVEIGD